jgi:phosphoglycolate phosphatase
MAKTFDLIVFDWDGTLMDSTAHIARSVQAACADLGLPIPSRERASHVIGLGLLEAMRYACPGLSDARYQEMIAAFRQHYLAGTQEITLFEGVEQGLAELRASGVFLAVATGMSRAGLDRSLTRTGLGDLFDATRTADECHSKPHPSMLLELTDQLGVFANRTLMIGDTTHDLMMANNAGTHSVGVSYGAHPSEQLQACSPLDIFDNFGALRQWLLTQLN